MELYLPKEFQKRTQETQMWLGLYTGTGCPGPCRGWGEGGKSNFLLFDTHTRKYTHIFVHTRIFKLESHSAF